MIEVVLFIIAYLIGSVPFGLLVGKIGYGIDIRQHGSGNLGGTNAFRTLGVKAGLIVTIADILKGTLAASLPFWFNIDLHPLLIGVFAVIGHMFPIFASFRGGKAVATSGGILLFAEPILFVTTLLVFFIGLYISRYVSLASMIGGVYAFIYSLIFSNDIVVMIIVAILAFFVIYRHRANIKRIMDRTEPQVKWIRKS